MRLFDDIKNFIDNKELEIHFINSKIYIVNYIEIVDFSNKKITLKHKNGNVYILGNNLVISKLLNEELMISGEISNIELR